MQRHFRKILVSVAFALLAPSEIPAHGFAASSWAGPSLGATPGIQLNVQTHGQRPATVERTVRGGPGAEQWL